MFQQRIEELRRQLEYHNFKYYVENAPEITDFEFDTMMRELQDLERAHPECADPNSPTQRVGSDLTSEFRTVRHRFPMLSLGNTYSLDELHEFIDRIEREVGPTEFVCELKFDGTAISLTYEHGRLLRAVTRGDGTSGDDVTANVRTIRSVPLVLRGHDWPDLFEIRGEILMPYASFDRLNAEREAAGEPLLANPRNAAAGTLKQQASAVVARRGLDCTLYQLAGDELPFKTHWESLEKARTWGFKVSDRMRICRTRAEIDDFIAYWDTARRELPFPTDGVVIKVNDFAVRRRDCFTIEILFCRKRGKVVSVLQTYAQLRFACLFRLQHFVHLLTRNTQRLFAKYVYVTFKCVNCHFAVQKVWRTDVQNVNLFVLEHLFVIGVQRAVQFVLRCQVLRLGKVDVAQRDYVCTALLCHLYMGTRYYAAPHNSNIHFVTLFFHATVGTACVQHGFRHAFLFDGSGNVLVEQFQIQVVVDG